MTRRSAAILSILLVITSCRQTHPSRLRDIDTLSLQPVGPVPPPTLHFLESELTRFLHRRILVRPPIAMPSGFRDDTKGERYSADSLLPYLSKNVSGDRSVVIGLTTDDIFTTVRDWAGATKLPRDKYEIWGIFGLGSCPGNSSIVSIHRLQTTDERLFLHRLRTVVLHELGHNLGLPHCSSAHCIMNDANEKIATIDNSGDDFCASCRKKIN